MSFIQKTNYQDFDLYFGKTLKGDVAKVTNERAIGQSIRVIVMTKSKLFKKDFGAGIESYFFSLMDPITMANLRDDIQQAIRRNEPRISGLKVVTEFQPDNNTVIISVYYQPTGSNKVAVVSMVLDIYKKWENEIQTIIRVCTRIRVQKAY